MRRLASLPSCYNHTRPSVLKLKRIEYFIINLDKKGGSSSLAKVHNGWLKLWSAKVPGKVRDYSKWILEFTKYNVTPNFGKIIRRVCQSKML
ncbi:hypothetical protein ZWY2020_049105 [Hordeum vulgare]|nr:hypothetical protein ZWY2020_049105 [Hordeum vulgare]